MYRRYCYTWITLAVFLTAFPAFSELEVSEGDNIWDLARIFVEAVNERSQAVGIAPLLYTNNYPVELTNTGMVYEVKTNFTGSSQMPYLDWNLLKEFDERLEKIYPSFVEANTFYANLNLALTVTAYRARSAWEQYEQTKVYPNWDDYKYNKIIFRSPDKYATNAVVDGLTYSPKINKYDWFFTNNIGTSYVFYTIGNRNPIITNKVAGFTHAFYADRTNLLYNSQPVMNYQQTPDTHIVELFNYGQATGEYKKDNTGEYQSTSSLQVLSTNTSEEEATFFLIDGTNKLYQFDKNVNIFDWQYYNDVILGCAIPLTTNLDVGEVRHKNVLSDFSSKNISLQNLVANQILPDGKILLPSLYLNVEYYDQYNDCSQGDRVLNCDEINFENTITITGDIYVEITNDPVVVYQSIQTNQVIDVNGCDKYPITNFWRITDIEQSNTESVYVGLNQTITAEFDTDIYASKGVSRIFLLEFFDERFRWMKAMTHTIPNISWTNMFRSGDNTIYNQQVELINTGDSYENNSVGYFANYTEATNTLPQEFNLFYSVNHRDGRNPTYQWSDGTSARSKGQPLVVVYTNLSITGNAKWYAYPQSAFRSDDEIYGAKDNAWVEIGESGVSIGNNLFQVLEATAMPVLGSPNYSKFKSTSYSVYDFGQSTNVIDYYQMYGYNLEGFAAPAGVGLGDISANFPVGAIIKWNFEHQ